MTPEGAIVDRRNPAPSIFLDSDIECPAEIATDTGYAGSGVTLGRYSGSRMLPPSLSISAPTIAQRYHCEIWCEKSTVNEILMPLGRQYGVNISTFVGELTATACRALVERARVSERPVRITYVSDFDPAGISMPVAAARKIEFFAMKAGLDIQLDPVVLTPKCLSEEFLNHKNDL
jgi:hypothetical protein